MEAGGGIGYDQFFQEGKMCDERALLTPAFPVLGIREVANVFRDNSCVPDLFSFLLPPANRRSPAG